MATSGVKVTGLKELAQFMQQLPEKLQKNVMRGALRAGAKVLENEAIQRAPQYSGSLANSIRVSTRTRKGVVTASVKTSDYKAHWVEYGTAAHWIRVDGKANGKRSLKVGDDFIGKSALHPGTKAQPFMRPALDNKGQEALVAAANYMKARLATKHGLDTSGVTIEAEE